MSRATSQALPRGHGHGRGGGLRHRARATTLARIGPLQQDRRFWQAGCKPDGALVSLPWVCYGGSPL
jgi:hypothetical protein